MAVNDYTDSMRIGRDDVLGRRVLSSGDAYAARRSSQVPGPTTRSISAEWRLLNETDFQSFLTDFEALGFTRSFSLTPPGDLSSSKFRFTSFSATPGVDVFVIRATLEKFNGV